MSRKTKRWLRMSLVSLLLFFGVLFLWIALRSLAPGKSPARLASRISTTLLFGGLTGLVVMVRQMAREIDELRRRLPRKRNSSDAPR